MYSLNNIRDEIYKYKLKKVLNSGENSMFDKKLDRTKIEQYLSQSENTEKKDIEQDVNANAVDLKKTLDSFEDEKLFESIINLKNRYVE